VEPPPFLFTHSALLYEPPVSEMIGAMKFGPSLLMAAALGEALADDLRRSRGWHDAVARHPHDATRRSGSTRPLLVPIPLDRGRRRLRGFDQANEIARVVSKACNVAYSTKLLVRCRPTAPQTSLGSRRARIANLRGAFEVARAHHVPLVPAVLIDDVMTTGATASEAARALLRAGIPQVGVWTVARTPR